jgi:hypothetical protein
VSGRRVTTPAGETWRVLVFGVAARIAFRRPWVIEATDAGS